MKKICLITAGLLFVIANMFGAAGSGKRLDTHGNLLEFTEIEIINNTPMPIKIGWYEVEMSKGQSIRIEKEVDAHTSKTLQLGEQGAFITRPYGSGTFIPDVSYKPILSDPNYTETYKLELDRPGPVIFSADSLADILKNIMRLGITYAGENGKPKTFQYLGMEHPSAWGKAMMRMDVARPVMTGPEYETQ